MKSISKKIIAISLLSLAGCKNGLPTEEVLTSSRICDCPEFSTVYYNSFESAQDTIGWQGIYQSMFVDDCAPDFGSKSLMIGGGCLQPVAYIDFDSSYSGHSYKLNCWGKVGLQGGALVLTTSTWDTLPHQNIGIQVTDSAWTHYSTTDTFYCAKDKIMRLEIIAGGIKPAYIYLDGIIIERVE